MTDPTNEDFYEALVDGDPLLSFIGARVTAVEEGRLEIAVPYGDQVALAEETPGLGGVVHAGVLATLVDMAGEVIRTELADPTGTALATTDLDVSYLRPATDDLVAVGRTERVGSGMAVSDVRVDSTDGDGEPVSVAVGRGSYRLLPVE